MEGLLQYCVTRDDSCPSLHSRAPNSDKYVRSVTLIMVVKIVAVCAIGSFLFADVIITE
jgi:hypothetical protein